MNILKRYPLVSFFLLAYSITWTFQLTGIVLAGRVGMTMSNETNFLYFIDLLSGRLLGQQALAYLIFSLGMGPLISAVVMTAILDGRPGLRELWARCTHWKVNGWWYVVIVAIPLALNLFSLLFAKLLTPGVITIMPKLTLAQFLPFLLYMIVFTGVAEEVGWRGFAQPRLQSRFTAGRTSWILGVLWAVWHFPFMIYFSASMGVGPVIGSLVGMVLATIGWTYVNTFLYNSTQSVLLVILLHGVGNALHSYLVMSSGNYYAQSIYGFLPWVIAVVLAKKYGEEKLALDPLPQRL